MRLWHALPAIVVLVSACSSAAPVSTAPAASTARTSTTTCRLPFVQNVGQGGNQAGFVDIPAGAFSADPRAQGGSVYYDSVVSRWLPVGRGAVSPDGRLYAYMTGGNPSNTPGPPRLHVVDAATGSEKVFSLPLSDQQPYGVVDYAKDGVYVGSGWEGATFGTWRVDPTTGATIDAGKQEHFIDDGTGHAWVAVVDKRDAHPALSAMSGQPLPNEIAQRDLQTGALTVWFYHPGVNIAFAAAFQTRGILVWAEPPAGPHEYWFVPSPGQAQLAASLDYGGQPVADHLGIWLGTNNALYLFSPNGAVAKVADVDGDPAGECL